LAKVDNENYRATIKDQVTRRWNLPHWLSNASLSATVKLFIDDRGILIKKELVRPSTNAVFDESVMRAIEAASPFPRPPSGLADQIAVWGISIEFVPQEN
jgi:TonB family protein